MRDYYKILGVEEEASEEEIRARWIELTKRYHPDLGETEEGDEKIREINEAYEILKDEPSRFQYDFERDLKRSFIKKAHRQQERRMNIWKIVIIPSSGILVLFLIVGFILFRRGDVAPLPKAEALYKVDKVPEKKTVPQIPPVKTDSIAQGKSRAPKEIAKEVMPPESKKMASLSPRLSPSAVERESEQEKEPPRKILPESKVPARVEKEPPAEKESESKEKLARQVVMKSEIPATKEVSKEVPKEIPRQIAKEIPKEVSKETPKQVAKEVPKEVPKEVSRVTLHPGENLTMWTRGEKVVSSRPSLLAKEEDVKQFFSSYVDRYNRKDVGGFLSFFSSKAIQNQTEGLEAIGNLYTKWVDQSEELRYQIEGMKIEIYQHRVDVRARFRVDQRLKRNGEEKVWKGNIRWVLVKEEGRLKIISLDY